MDQKEYLGMIRGLYEGWLYHELPELSYVFGKIVEVNSDLTVRIRRQGESYPDGQFWPTVGPWTPVVGQDVLCGKLSGGLIVLGPFNTDEPAGSTSGALPDVLTDHCGMKWLGYTNYGPTSGFTSGGTRMRSHGYGNIEWIISSTSSDTCKIVSLIDAAYRPGFTNSRPNEGGTSMPVRVNPSADAVMAGTAVFAESGPLGLIVVGGADSGNPTVSIHRLTYGSSPNFPSIVNTGSFDAPPISSGVHPNVFVIDRFDRRMAYSVWRSGSVGVGGTLKRFQVFSSAPSLIDEISLESDETDLFSLAVLGDYLYGTVPIGGEDRIIRFRKATQGVRHTPVRTGELYLPVETGELYAGPNYLIHVSFDFPSCKLTKINTDTFTITHEFTMDSWYKASHTGLLDDGYFYHGFKDQGSRQLPDTIMKFDVSGDTILLTDEKVEYPGDNLANGSFQYMSIWDEHLYTTPYASKIALDYCHTAPIEVDAIRLTNEWLGEMEYATQYGRYLYFFTPTWVTDASPRLRAFDLEGSFNVPIVDLELPLDDSSELEDPVIHGDKMYIGWESSTERGFLVVSLTVPIAPVIIGSTALPATDWDLGTAIDEEGHFIYKSIIQDPIQFEKWDVTTPNPTYVKDIIFPDNLPNLPNPGLPESSGWIASRNHVIKGNYLYVTFHDFTGGSDTPGDYLGKYNLATETWELGVQVPNANFNLPYLYLLNDGTLLHLGGEFGRYTLFTKFDLDTLEVIGQNFSRLGEFIIDKWEVMHHFAEFNGTIYAVANSHVWGYSVIPIDLSGDLSHVRAGKALRLPDWDSTGDIGDIFAWNNRLFIPEIFDGNGPDGRNRIVVLKEKDTEIVTPENHVWDSGEITVTLTESSVASPWATTHPIEFNSEFEIPPKLYLFINGITYNGGTDTQVRLVAEEVTSIGATARLQFGEPKTSGVGSVKFTWLAVGF